MVQEQASVQMVDLVLDGSRQHAIAGDLDALTIERRAGDRRSLVSGHLCVGAWNTQASFALSLRLALDRDQLRVDQNVELALDIENDDLL